MKQKLILCAIEQEAKYMSDSAEGSKQYRKGYRQALETIAQFLSLEERGNFPQLPCGSPIERLCSFAHLEITCSS